jgi:hypothetical protein
MNFKKIRYELLVSIIIFFVGGLWMPIVCGAKMEILRFIYAGISSVAILWGGAVIYFLIKRSCKIETP